MLGQRVPMLPVAHTEAVLISEPVAFDIDKARWPRRPWMRDIVPRLRAGDPNHLSSGGRKCAQRLATVFRRNEVLL